MLRYLNMFVLIGIALIGISIVGFLTGNSFLTEPGQTLNPYGSWIYLGAGVMMILNGLVSIRVAPPQPERPAAEKEPEKKSEQIESTARS